MKTFGLICIVVILVVAGYFFLRQTPSSKQDTPSLENQITPQPSIDNSALKQGGSSMSDPAGTYSVLYPADYIFDSQDPQHLRIYKTGATQKGQTEMYDGVILVFEVISLDGSTLSDWIDMRLKQATADGTSEVIESPSPVLVNNQPGFRYKTRGLGESTYYAVQKDTTSPFAVLVATLVADPQQVGFQTEVDMILSTLEVLK